MTGYAKPDRTNVFKNGYKSSETHPDYKGKLHVSTDLLRALVDDVKGGKDAVIDIAMWVNKQHDGTPYFSTRVSRSMPKEEMPGAVTESLPPVAADDEIPF